MQVGLPQPETLQVLRSPEEVSTWSPILYLGMVAEFYTTPCRESVQESEGTRPNLTRGALSGGIPRQLATSDSLGRTLAPGLGRSPPEKTSRQGFEPPLFLRANRRVGHGPVTVKLFWDMWKKK
jgi:hypothetical protein